MELDNANTPSKKPSDSSNSDIKPSDNKENPPTPDYEAENSDNKENIAVNDSKSDDYEKNLHEYIEKTSETLKNINSIKDEICKLPLNVCENEYITNSIYPLTNILYLLSTSSYNLINAVNLLNTTPIVKPKKSKLKDTIHLVYDIDEECEDIFEVVKRRLNKIL